MKKWYEANYFNHHDWIMDNLERLELSNDEILLCLVVEFFKKHNIEMSYTNIANKLKITESDVDRMICELVSKSFINIVYKDNQMSFDLKPMYEMEFEDNSTEFKTIFDHFEETFNRPLNSTELSKISDFIKMYKEEEILNALRIADAYQKVSIAYIETVLRNESNNG